MKTRAAFASLASLAFLLGCVFLSAHPALSQEASVLPKPLPDDELPTLEDVAGLWYSDFGYMDLEVKGDEIHGTYSCCDGTLTGKLNVARLELEWKDPIYGEGWVYLYWQSGGRRLKGTFGKVEDFGASGQWNAVRIPEFEPSEPPTRFRVEATQPRFGELGGTVLLDLSGEKIRGELRGHYRLEAQEKPFLYEMFNVLTGRREGDGLVLTWMDPVKLRRGEIHLEPAEGGGWKGIWRPHFTLEGEEPFRLEPAEPEPAEP